MNETNQTKTRLEKIAELEEQITNIRKRQQKERQKHNKAERTARTRRLCERMGLIESMLPETIPLTADNFKIYLEKTICTDNSRRILDGLLTAQTAATPTPEGAGSAARVVPTPASKTPQTAQENGEDEDTDEGNGEAQTPAV
jgi:hypothetical protein